MIKFRDGLKAGEDFIITCELIPGRGFTGKSIEKILQFAEGVKNVTDIHALSLTDNAGGNPALSADVLGREILQIGVDLIVHFSCKDMNRNEIESRAYALNRTGITNLLVITGDYPISGFLGLPKPVFDVDAVNAIYYLNEMNNGLEIVIGSKSVRLERTDFYIGAVASPFKWTEASSIMQYKKLEKKIRAGADFIITQLGYDSRKRIEMIMYIRKHLDLKIPILGSVYVLTAGAAKIMSKGEI
ncbi:MAG: methylenetetrahydrofolate reductase, partial [Spirochaetota bacterium]